MEDSIKEQLLALLTMSTAMIIISIRMMAAMSTVDSRRVGHAPMSARTVSTPVLVEMVLLIILKNAIQVLEVKLMLAPMTALTSSTVIISLMQMLMELKMS